MVGKIVNNVQETFTKGEEKGYFKLGGSTIVILLKENQIILDKDISTRNASKIMLNLLANKTG